MSEWPCSCTPPGIVEDFPASPLPVGCPRHDSLPAKPWTKRDEQEMEKQWPRWREGRFDSPKTTESERDE